MSSCRPRTPLAAAALCALLLQACGSGDDGDDDAVPRISAPAAAVAEGDAGNTPLRFELRLSRPAESPVSVDYATADGSAVAGSDYLAAAGRAEFAPGDTRKTVDVAVVGDTDVEGDETLSLRLSDPRNATLAAGAAAGTIVDDDAVGGPFGLDARPDNRSCIAPPRPGAAGGIDVADPYPGIAFSQPTKLLLEPGVADPRWFVLEKGGAVKVFDPADAAAAPAIFIDLDAAVHTSFEAGLLGLAFHPGYPGTPEIFLSYNRRTGGQTQSVISRFVLDDVTSPGPGTVEEVLLLVDQSADNHNGGDIAFGPEPDPYLYIGLGDGGGDPGSAQDTTRLLGSMLRIDVTDPQSPPYDIPADNPFAANPRCGPSANAADCPEIFAWGFRNPWRWRFDPDTGELWLGDVGEDAYEEVDKVVLGGNYGWPCREGAHDRQGCVGNFVDPVAEYPHPPGQVAIAGGAVYRGAAIAELAGRYVFGDAANGRFFALAADGSGGFTVEELLDTTGLPTSFAVGPDGELYFTDIGSGRLGKIRPAGGGNGDTIAARLSQSGCTDPADVTRPNAGLVPFDLRAPFWSDGAHKERFAGVPNGATITIHDSDYWGFPKRTVLVKNFRLNGRLIETRHLMHHPDGSWAGYTYEWNDAQTEAIRVVGGKVADKDGQDWIFPSGAECMECHTSVAGFSLGPETAQLNGEFTYPQTGRRANQLATLDRIAMFSAPLADPPDALPVLADPADGGAPLAARARAWLHSNCAQCHRDGGPTPAKLDLRHDTPLAATGACDVAPSLGDLGIAGARLIAPGDAARSVLLARVARRGLDGMPPLGSNAVDAAGVALLSAWIDGLNDCR